MGCLAETRSLSSWPRIPAPDMARRTCIVLAATTSSFAWAGASPSFRPTPDGLALKWSEVSVRVRRNNSRNHHLNDWIEHRPAGRALERHPPKEPPCAWAIRRTSGADSVAATRLQAWLRPDSGERATSPQPDYISAHAPCSTRRTLRLSAGHWSQRSSRFRAPAAVVSTSSRTTSLRWAPQGSTLSMPNGAEPLHQPRDTHISRSPGTTGRSTCNCWSSTLTTARRYHLRSLQLVQEDIDPDLNCGHVDRVSYDLRALGSGRYTLVHRLNSAPPEVELLESLEPFIEMVDGEPVLRTELSL